MVFSRAAGFAGGVSVGRAAVGSPITATATGEATSKVTSGLASTRRQKRWRRPGERTRSR